MHLANSFHSQGGLHCWSSVLRLLLLAGNALLSAAFQSHLVNVFCSGEHLGSPVGGQWASSTFRNIVNCRHQQGKVAGRRRQRPFLQPQPE